MTDTEALASALEVLLGYDPARQGVRVACVRALHDAWSTAMPPSATVASNAAVLLDGDQYRSLGDERCSAARHADLAVALRAGSVDGALVLVELVRHALLAPAPLAARLLRDPFEALAGSGFTATIEHLRAEVDAAPPDAPGRVVVLDLISTLLLDAGAAEALPSARAAFDVAASADAPDVAARIALAASWTAPPDEASTWRLRALEPSATGWSRRARSLELIACGRRDKSVPVDRAIIRHAVRTGDARLEASALVAIANAAAAKGDARTAVQLERRALRIAARAHAWREHAIGSANLAWLLVEQLDLSGARAVIDELVAVVDRPGLARYRTEARLHAASIALIEGDVTSATNHLSGLELDSAEPHDEDSAWDAAYRAIRVAEVHQLRHDAAGVIAALGVARSLIERFGIVGKELEIVLLTCRIGPDHEREQAARLLPALLGTTDPYYDAQAVAWLARAHTIEALDVTDALRDCLASLGSDLAPIVRQAVDEATALLGGDWRGAERAADSWRAHGFGVDAALARVAAAEVAARDGHGARAGVMLEAAHRSLAAIGAACELNALRSVRRRHATILMRPDVARSSFLDSLAPELRTMIDDMAVERVLARGRSVPDDMLALLVDGVVLVEVSPSPGRWELVDVLGAGAVVGASTAVDMSSDRQQRMITRTTCTVRLIPIDVLVARAATAPSLALALARVASEDSRRARQRLVLRTAPLDARCAALVLELADTAGTTGTPDSGHALNLRLSRAELGSLLGVTRESATRSLTRHQEAGLITTHGHTLVVSDRARLARAAGSLN